MSRFEIFWRYFIFNLTENLNMMWGLKKISVFRGTRPYLSEAADPRVFFSKWFFIQNRPRIPLLRLFPQFIINHITKIIFNHWKPQILIKIILQLTLFFVKSCLVFVSEIGGVRNWCKYMYCKCTLFTSNNVLSSLIWFLKGKITTESTVFNADNCFKLMFQQLSIC